MGLGIPIAQRWMIGTVALGIPFSAVGAIYPENTWLQVGPVAILLPLAIWLLRRWPVSNFAAGCIAVFILLHLLAARWSYSYVPYRDWLGIVQNSSEISDRNMFDRLVHFAFGLLAILPFTEITIRYAGLGKRGALLGAVLFVLAVGGLYEVFEWTLTMAMAPADAGAYNGEQGDRFDSQKDMAIAAIGAILAILPSSLLLTLLREEVSE